MTLQLRQQLIDCQHLVRPWQVVGLLRQQFDMIGMDFFYADQQAQSPSDEENAAALARLIADGYANSILISQDVFLKMMLTRHGGFGYGYILKHFVPRLHRHGVDRATVDRILVDNPRRVFSATYRDAA